MSKLETMVVEQEAGLEAANLALSMPLIFGGANTSCGVDSDRDSLGEGLSCQVDLHGLERRVLER